MERFHFGQASFCMLLSAGWETTWVEPAPRHKYTNCREILHNSSQDPGLSQTHNCVNHLGLFAVRNVIAASRFLSLSLSPDSFSPRDWDEWGRLCLIFDWQNKHCYHNSKAGRQTTSSNRGRRTHHTTVTVYGSRDKAVTVWAEIGVWARRW